jgi:hypothetical protein
MSVILDNISSYKKEIRKKTVECLKEQHFKASEKDFPKLFHALTATSQQVAWDISALASLESSENSSTLFKALEFEYQDHINQLMNLLAITYNPQSVQHVKDHLYSGSSEGVGYALELFDLFLSDEIKPMILAAFEDLPLTDKAHLLESFFPIEISSPEKTLIRIINRDPNLISKTTKKIALQLYTEYYQEVTDDIIAQLFNTESELQSIAVHIVNQIEPGILIQVKNRIQTKNRIALERTQSRAIIDGMINYPIDNCENIQKLLDIDSADFIDLISDFDINTFTPLNISVTKDQLTNYFVFLILDQYPDSTNLNSNTIHFEGKRNSNEVLLNEGQLILGLKKERMNKLMVLNKKFIQKQFNNLPND